MEVIFNVALATIIIILFLLCVIIWRITKQNKINEKIDSLAGGVEEITPQEFFKLRNFSFGGRGHPKYALTKNFSGIYIIYNKTKKKYYIGQTTRILDRVNNHFTGKGNGDIYADYKYGDMFTIKMIALENSGYHSLNDLERDAIKKYNSFAKGYNKTRGNK